MSWMVGGDGRLHDQRGRIWLVGITWVAIAGVDGWNKFEG